MKNFLRMFAIGLALAAAGCGPQKSAAAQGENPAEPPKEVSHLLLEFDLDRLRADELNVHVSRDIRDRLREKPQIAIGADGRKLVGDHLEVKPSKAADVSAAAERIVKLPPAQADVAPQPSPYELTVRPDNVIEVRIAAEAFGKLTADTLDGSLATAQRRLKSSDFSNATVVAQAPNRLLVEAPGADDATLDRLARLLTRNGMLTINMVDDAANAADYKQDQERNGRIAVPNDSRGGKLMVLFTDAIITGADIASATDGLDSNRSADIEFRLRPAAAQRFGVATKDNVGKSFAIVIDSHILSAPKILDPITGGAGVISGDFTLEEAKDLADVLRAGPLPAPLTVVEKKAVAE